jgi:predicted nucleotidyltransferase
MRFRYKAKRAAGLFMNEYESVVIEISRERRKYFEDPAYYARLIKDLLGFKDLEVLLFGSVVEGQCTMASDIDLFIVSDEVPRSLDERAKLLNRINDAVGYLHPFEVHLITTKEYDWYKRFIKPSIKI